MKTISRILIIVCAFLTSVTSVSAQWTQANGPYGGVITALAVSGTNIYAGTRYFGVFRSTNNGASWTRVNTGLPGDDITAFAVSSTNLFAGTLGKGVFLSTDNGASWTAINNGLTNTQVHALAVSGTNLFAGTGGGVFRSTNNGASWTALNTGLTNTYVNALAVSGMNIYAGTWYGGVFLSTNNGTSWTAVNTGLPKYATVFSFAVSGPNLYAGTTDGIFVSANDGESWTAVNTGLRNTVVAALAVSGTKLYAGILGAGVWKRPLSEMVTSVEGTPPDLPKAFSLGQNFPNPFNPSTMISFSLPSRSFVVLKVFDALGREVSNVVSEELPAGNHSRHWDAADLSSGVYFYRLQAGPFTATRKLILVR